MDSSQRGFTLVELLLSVSIITILAGLSLPMYASFYNRANLDTSAEQIAQALRRAQTFSRAVNGDSIWGVSVQPDSAVLFKGSSYSARDASYDEVIALPNIVTTGTSEVAFTKLYGMPSVAGAITLSNNNNETRTISFNVKGLVTY